VLPDPQTKPQLPQLSGSKDTSTQMPPQSTCPSGHEGAGGSSAATIDSSGATTGSSGASVAALEVAELAVTQFPFRHSSPAAHLVLQSPQKFGSFSVSAQKPPAVLKHWANPTLQFSAAI
jgi:hypothetical protein